MTNQGINSISIKKYSYEYFGERIGLCDEFLLYIIGIHTPKSKQNTSISYYNTIVNRSQYATGLPWSGVWQNEITIRLITFATWFFAFTTWLITFATWFFKFTTLFFTFAIWLIMFTRWFFQFTTWLITFTIRSTKFAGHHLFKISKQKDKYIQRK